MDHVAIMNPKLGLIDKILSGEKTIESRWYQHKSAPWNKVFFGETIYFKESGGPVRAKATVAKVLQLYGLNSERIDSIIKTYGKRICLQQPVGQKNYCILIFLKNPESIAPFRVNKSGFGSAVAWLAVDTIKSIF